ncbi:unnamed protein product [Protopolystoma xenopodis]|uniref:Uncharacterized protein n=1 Tax=Protopolystoma xenopodis TaxID=117903 RepID=A0A3S5BXK9_9PLAT|nr:unnamed protein product [Protopolystoma xenopodis]
MSSVVRGAAAISFRRPDDHGEQALFSGGRDTVTSLEGTDLARISHDAQSSADGKMEGIRRLAYQDNTSDTTHSEYE